MNHTTDYVSINIILLKCKMKAAILKTRSSWKHCKNFPRYVAMFADQFLNVCSPFPPYDLPLLPPLHLLMDSKSYMDTHLLHHICWILKPVSCYLSWSPDLHHFLSTAQSSAVLFLSSLLFLLCGKQMKNHGLREVSVYWWKGTICVRGRFCNSFAVEHVL